MEKYEKNNERNIFSILNLQGKGNKQICIVTFFFSFRNEIAVEEHFEAMLDEFEEENIGELDDEEIGIVFLFLFGCFWKKYVPGIYYDPVRCKTLARVLITQVAFASAQRLQCTSAKPWRMCRLGGDSRPPHNGIHVLFRYITENAYKTRKELVFI